MLVSSERAFRTQILVRAVIRITALEPLVKKALITAWRTSGTARDL